MLLEFFLEEKREEEAWVWPLQSPLDGTHGSRARWAQVGATKG